MLVVDSLPRWEYRYLRNALARDPGRGHAVPPFHPEIGPGDGPDYIPAFPATKEALAPYDVIFLGDVGIGQNELTETNAAMIRGLVEQQASGLVFVPGPRGREATFLNSPLADLYPVLLDPAKPQGIGLQNEAQLVLTSAGKHHWLTRFDSDEDRNDELWKQLPGFFWSAAVEKSRPGSEVLAVHSSLRNDFGRVPLLVTRSAGAGKVLFLGTDSAWRWRRGVEDKFHYRFWGQVVRWMAHQRHLSEKDGIRLSYSPEAPQAGDPVYLQSTVLDESGFPIDKGPVTGKITSPGGRVERLEFAPAGGRLGRFQVRLHRPGKRPVQNGSRLRGAWPASGNRVAGGAAPPGKTGPARQRPDVARDFRRLPGRQFLGGRVRQCCQADFTPAPSPVPSKSASGSGAIRGGAAPSFSSWPSIGSAANGAGWSDRFIWRSSTS